MSATRLNELERLQLIASTLPQEAVEALIQVAQHMVTRTVPTGEEDFLKRLAAAPAEEVDEQTARELREALSVPGEPVSLADLKRELGLQ